MTKERKSEYNLTLKFVKPVSSPRNINVLRDIQKFIDGNPGYIRRATFFKGTPAENNAISIQDFIKNPELGKNRDLYFLITAEPPFAFAKVDRGGELTFSLTRNPEDQTPKAPTPEDLFIIPVINRYLANLPFVFGSDD